MKRLLEAIAKLHVSLFQVEYAGQHTWQLLPLPKLLLRVLELLGLPPSLYLDLALNCVRPPPNAPLSAIAASG